MNLWIFWWKSTTNQEEETKLRNFVLFSKMEIANTGVFVETFTQVIKCRKNKLRSQTFNLIQSAQSAYNLCSLTKESLDFSTNATTSSVWNVLETGDQLTTGAERQSNTTGHAQSAEKTLTWYCQVWDLWLAMKRMSCLRSMPRHSRRYPANTSIRGRASVRF